MRDPAIVPVGINELPGVAADPNPEAKPGAQPEAEVEQAPTLLTSWPLPAESTYSLFLGSLFMPSTSTANRCVQAFGALVSTGLQGIFIYWLFRIVEHNAETEDEPVFRCSEQGSTLLMAAMVVFTSRVVCEGQEGLMIVLYFYWALAETEKKIDETKDNCVALDDEGNVAAHTSVNLVGRICISLIVLVKLGSAACMIVSGMQFLAQSATAADVLLNALALEFILVLDDTIGPVFIAYGDVCTRSEEGSRLHADIDTTFPEFKRAGIIPWSLFWFRLLALASGTILILVYAVLLLQDDAICEM